MSKVKDDFERDGHGLSRRKLIADFPSGILLSVSVRDLQELERSEPEDADDSSNDG